jgi:3'-phosphoadenosine 5'-phosphosulfate sulfotransferase (PAPS reductase)/FAD synthetase
MNIQDRIRESAEIVHRAMLEFKPYSTVLMLSGGDDSRLTMEVLREIGITPDFIIHGVTGTGIQEAQEFVRQVATNSGITYREADAGDAYLNYVMRKGFFGAGNDAHALSYHVLKATAFRKTVSSEIRHGKPNRPVLFFNGVRVDETDNRSDKLGDKIFNRDPAAPNNIWVNVVHWWTTKERDEYLVGNGIIRNPVSIAIGRSGECMCGTTQSMATGLEAAEHFPRWGKWWLDIRKQVIKRFPWDWSQNINQYHLKEMNGQGNLLKDEPFMPMCVGCRAKQKKNKIITPPRIIETLPINEGLFKP